MSHQDQKHICRNASEIQAVLTRLLPASVIEFRRHGNAVIPAQTLVSVSLIMWGWLSGGTIDERLAGWHRLAGFAAYRCALAQEDFQGKFRLE